MGLTTRHAGTITLGTTIGSKPGADPSSATELGLGYVPQQREIFPSLSVEENLAVAARAGGWSIEAVFELFPGLAERRSNSGNKLSGGEQQMLAIGRALVGGPKVLLLDEPLEGLAPIVVEALFEALSRIRDEAKLSMVLVEQKVDLALAFAREVAVLDRGKIVYRAPARRCARTIPCRHVCWASTDKHPAVAVVQARSCSFRRKCCTLPSALRGSESTNTTSRGSL